MKQYVSSTLALVFFVGCATTQSLPVETRTRAYDFEYDRVFRVVLEALTEEGYAVVDAQLDTGIINTDFLLTSGFKQILFGKTRQKVTALVSETSTGSEVVLNLALQEADDFGTYSTRILPAGTARDYYRNLFGVIASKLVE